MNISHNSTEEEEKNDEQLSGVSRVILIAAYVIILLFSVVGNSLLIHIVRTRINIRKNPFNWLLVNTAMADLVIIMTASAFNLPYFICNNNCWISGILGSLLCKLIPYFMVVAICTSIWTLTIIAIERYLAIVCMRGKPLSSKSVVRSIISLWLCAGLIFIGPLFKYKTKKKDGATICDEVPLPVAFKNADMVLRVVVTYAVPLIIMAVLYSLIAFFLWRYKPPGERNFNRQAHARQARNRRAVIKMMMTAVTVFALCWLPVHVCHITFQFYEELYFAFPKAVILLLYWLAHANAAIHPWLFIAFSENLRVETKAIFRNFWRKPNQVEIPHELSLTTLNTDPGALPRGGTNGNFNVSEDTAL